MWRKFWGGERTKRESGNGSNLVERGVAFSRERDCVSVSSIYVAVVSHVPKNRCCCCCPCTQCFPLLLLLDIVVRSKSLLGSVSPPRLQAGHNEIPTSPSAAGKDVIFTK